MSKKVLVARQLHFYDVLHGTMFEEMDVSVLKRLTHPEYHDEH